MTNNILENKTTLIFDMDGTLIDSIGMWNQTDFVLINRIKRSDLQISPNFQQIREDVLDMYHDQENPYRSYCAYLQNAYEAPYTLDEIYQMRYDIAHELQRDVIDYKENADEFLRQAKEKGYRLVLASATRRSSLDIYNHENQKMIEKAKLEETFERIYGKEDISEMKPSPAIYLKVLSELALKPEECIVFEDSLAGIKAAKGAGIDAVAVYDSYSDHDRRSINQLSDVQIDDWSQALLWL